MFKTNYIFGILILFILISCGRTVDVSEVTSRNNKFYLINEKRPFTGVITQSDAMAKVKNGLLEYREIYYPNGQICLIERFKKGIHSGIYEVYYINGQLTSKVNYKDGLEVGNVTIYAEDGKIMNENFYKKGKLEGEQRVFDKNGKLFIKADFKDGLFTGNVECYNDKLMTYKRIIKDKKIDVTTYDKNGKTSGLYHFIDNSNTERVNGILKYKCESEEYTSIADALKYFLIYSQDNPSYESLDSMRESIKDGEFLTYSDGKLQSVTRYKNNLREGVMEKYTEEGKLLITRTYVNDKLEGEITLYYPETNKVKAKANAIERFDYYILEGSYIEYYENGNERVKTTYSNNQIFGDFQSNYENGSPQIKFTIDDNKYLQGDAVCYYPTGEIEYKSAFLDNDLESYTHYSEDQKVIPNEDEDMFLNRIRDVSITDVFGICQYRSHKIFDIFPTFFKRVCSDKLTLHSAIYTVSYPILPGAFQLLFS